MAQLKIINHYFLILADCDNVNTLNVFGLDADKVWDTEQALKQLQSVGQAGSKRTAERRLHKLGILPKELAASDIQDELERPANKVVLNWSLEKARSKRRLVLFLQLHLLPDGQCSLHANDARGARYWVPIHHEACNAIEASDVMVAMNRLQRYLGKEIAVFPHGSLVGLLRHTVSSESITISSNNYLPILALPVQSSTGVSKISHLKHLEAEGIHIIREAVAEAENPVMLYSGGKDSSVMLHLARKAFYPSSPPFPLMHVDTRWKFQEIYAFRDHMSQVSGMDLLVHISPEAIAKDINPFDHGSALHTDVTEIEGLKQALDKFKFDAMFGGARRDEEKSRAKERIYSFRSQSHRWDPKNQRPELWDLINMKKHQGESFRVFPLSNWTEIDIWQYIYQDNIPVVSLYFAKKRPVVVRDGMILLVDDSRFRLLPGEEIVDKLVRFRTLGCYPLTGAVESSAASLPEIILELFSARNSERQGRIIDMDAYWSMEKKKREGYF